MSQDFKKCAICKIPIIKIWENKLLVEDLTEKNLQCHKCDSLLIIYDQINVYRKLDSNIKKVVYCIECLEETEKFIKDIELSKLIEENKNFYISKINKKHQNFSKEIFLDLFNK